MGTSLIASLAIHPSISRYVASLLAPKSHSFHCEQNTSLIARSSELVVFLAHSSARWPRSSGLRPCGGAGNPHPLLTTLIDVCLRKHQWQANINGIVRCQDSRSSSEVPYHYHMHGEPYKPPPPPQEVSHKNTTKIYHILESELVPQK